MTAEDAQAAPGNKYDDATGGGATLFTYQVDNTSHSVLIAHPSVDVGYFEALGFPTTQYNGEPFSSSTYANYTSAYLFTSDDMVAQTGTEYQVRIKLTVSDGQVTTARVWVNGVPAIDSDRL